MKKGRIYGNQLRGSRTKQVGLSPIEKLFKEEQKKKRKNDSSTQSAAKPASESEPATKKAR